MKVKLLSRVRLFVTPWTVAYQAPPSMGFSRRECWSGLPFPSPGDLPDSGVEPGSPTLQADTLPSEPPGKPQPYTTGVHFTIWYCIILGWPNHSFGFSHKLLPNTLLACLVLNHVWLFATPWTVAGQPPPFLIRTSWMISSADIQMNCIISPTFSHTRRLLSVSKWK